jgi:hypothetical protein
MFMIHHINSDGFALVSLQRNSTTSPLRSLITRSAIAAMAAL